MKINIKRDRELLGLPIKRKYNPPRMLKILVSALIVFLVASGIGKVIGKQVELNKQYSIFSSVTSLNSNYNVSQTKEILKQLRDTAIHGSTEAKLLYAHACSYAANILPEYNIWNEEGLFQINQVLDDSLLKRDLYIVAVILKTSFLFDMDREKEAFAEIKKINADKSIGEILNTNPGEVEGALEYYNLYAYMLATAKETNLKNPELALKLIKKVIIDPDGRNASYLDTLAEAYFSNDRIKDAKRVQRFALAKSQYPSLWMLTEHYIKLTDK